jgi:hypothetical protein
MKFEYSDADNSIMRIPVRLWWIPLTFTVAGLAYQSMVALGRYQAALKDRPVGRVAPKPFVPPPPMKPVPVAIPEPPAVEPLPLANMPTALPAFQPAALPPFPRKNSK